MAPTQTMLIIFTIASLFLITTSAQNCKNYTFSDNQVFESCTDLPVLEAHLHWSYDPSQQTVQIAYRANQTPRGWIAWGINPTGKGMIGTQALVSFQEEDTGVMKAYPTQIAGYNTSLEPQDVNFMVSELSAEYSNDEMIIFAVVGPLNATSFNIVWQAGGSVSNNIPQPHPVVGPNLKSFATWDFLSAKNIEHKYPTLCNPNHLHQ